MCVLQVRVVVAINRFHSDTDAEIALVAKLAKQVATRRRAPARSM